MERVAGRPVVLTQRWAGIVWAHWRVDPAAVAALLPPPLRVDVFDGAAWVGLVPFQMEDLRLVLGGRRLPPIGSTRSFSEVNVRTYVLGPSGPGVWFHSLDATSRLAVAVARGAWSLPYRAARVDAAVDPGRRTWRVRRRPGVRHHEAPHGALVADIGAPVAAAPLDTFLTARFRLYAPLRRHLLLTAPVRHRTWPLRAATLDELDAGLVDAAGYRVGTSPPDHVVAADDVEVSVGLPSLLRVAPAAPAPDRRSA